MKKQTLFSLTAAVILVSQIFTITAFGQKISVQHGESLIKRCETADRNEVFSKYIRNLTRFAADGKIAFTAGSETAAARIEEAAAKSGRMGIIIVDRYRKRKTAIAGNQTAFAPKDAQRDK